jgi:hypothetical protein
MKTEERIVCADPFYQDVVKVAGMRVNRFGGKTNEEGGYC